MTSSPAYFVAVAIAAVALLCNSPRLLAQGEDDPLQFQTEFHRIGGEIGLSSNWQSGIYETGCGVFEKGAKISPLIAAAYDYPLGAGFRIEALLGYQSRSLKSSYNSRESVPVRYTVDGQSQVTLASVDFENVGNANFSYLFLLPSVKFYFGKVVYVGAGISAGLLTSATTQYTKNILSKTIEIPGDFGSEPVAVSYSAQEASDPFSKVDEEEQRDDASGFALDGAVYVGAEFAFGRRIKVGPRVLFTLPFTPVFSNPELKINTLQFLVGLRYDLR